MSITNRPTGLKRQTLQPVGSSIPPVISPRAARAGESCSAEALAGAGAAQRRRPARAQAQQLQPAAHRAALGNTAIAFPVSKIERSRRSERWDLRDGLREFSRIESVRKCGIVPIAPLVSLRADSNGGRAGYGGLSTCGSVWVCPVCSAKIASRRKGELEDVLQHATAHGFEVSMLTLTQRHHQGQRLGDLWDALSSAWNSVTSGRRWLEFKEQLGLVGWVKAVEVTHGKAGWHVHIHVLVISEKNPETTLLFWQRKQGRKRTPYPVEWYSPAEFIAARWSKGLAKHGVDFIADKGGLDWEVARDARAMARYVAKMQTNGKETPKSNTDAISSEATLGGFKKARRGNRTPFQILADIIENGDAADLDIWSEYERFSRGRRALTWSKGLRDWAGLGQEQTDEEIAEEEAGDETIANFDHDAWKQVRAAGAAELLDVTEQQGAAAALAWLDDRHIRWSPPTKRGKPRIEKAGYTPLLDPPE